jgi:beta-lactam-binding protein with PASTA domain
MVLGTRLLFIQFYDANNENSDELSQLPSAEEVLIPSGVVGSESQIAQELLRSARVRFRTRFEYDDSVPRLHVVSLSHNEGEMIPGAEIITMVLSHGPARRALPQQIGLPGESAHETLTALGFVVEYADPINSDVIPADHVIFQEPNDGTWLLPGETVTLTISLGAAP